jgi:acyl dehydratase
MALAEISGRRYGPSAAPVAAALVAAFVEATGDDSDRWREHAPPSYAAAVLFTVAPQFLADPDVAPATRSLIHTEQSFTWHRPLPVGERLAVQGTVAGVRSRGPLDLVTFDLAASGEDGPWLDGSATFMMSSEAAATSDEEAEPSSDEKALDETPAPAPMPAPGEPVPGMVRSASRADLERYAAASGDRNPIHLDHTAAVSAGLPGVIVHGLLMASWLVQAASRHAPGPHPLSAMRLRFRKPLRPAAPAHIGGEVAEEGTLSMSIESGGAKLVSATARVTA